MDRAHTSASGSGGEHGSRAVATLAHVADTSPAPLHSSVWAEWREELTGQALAGFETPSSPGEFSKFKGFAGAEIPCRVWLPEGRPAGVLIEAPDASNTCGDSTGLSKLGLAVVQVGLRGCESGAHAGHHWATAGLGEGIERAEDALRWRPVQAAGDVAAAILQAHAQFGVPVFVRGRSLGAGLAVLAIAGMGQPSMVARLVLELPGLGDWRWRWAQAAKSTAEPVGVGGDLLASASRFPARRQELFHSLKLIDAAVAATRINCPTLCKLAEQDEVVPAATAAAIYNALGCTVGQKYRFVVPVGHGDGGIANARRHALFERCAGEFLDPKLDPEASMRSWWSVLSGGGEERVSEEQAALFAEQDLPRAAGAVHDTDAVLIQAYEHSQRTLDDLPYTPEFERLYDASGSVTGLSRRDVLHRLQTLRKAGRLPRLGRSSGTPPRIDPAHEILLGELVCASIGKLSLRDRLPYTPEFDELVAEFNLQAGLMLAPHEVWRLVAKLAK
jgi:cephalosporin-C deacetylase-like acetyl esterase